MSDLERNYKPFLIAVLSLTLILSVFRLCVEPKPMHLNVTTVHRIQELQHAHHSDIVRLERVRCLR